MKSNKKEINFVIHAIHGYLNEKKDKVVADVSWYDGESKLNIRSCYKDKADKLMLGGGIALSADEVSDLSKILESIDIIGSKLDDDAVDYDDIFDIAKSVVANRADGYKTEDGFIILEKTDKFTWKPRRERA